MIFSEYLSNERMTDIVSDESLIRYMIQFEIALAKAQSIPASARDEIVNVLEEIEILPLELTEGTLKHGIPVVPFVNIIKTKLSAEGRRFFHYGATSQDVMDTAQAMILQEASGIIAKTGANLVSVLTRLGNLHGHTKCMARTRGQLATHITFSVKVESWRKPVERLLAKLRALTNEVSCVQLGGPVGTYNDEHVIDELAGRLGLNAAKSWHSQRDSLAEFTNLLAILTGVLGKMGADIITMSQTEVGEIEEIAGGSGKSSSMPHKSNPVLSEALVAIARINAGLQSIQLQSVVHQNERDGSALILEWATIPQMLIYTATSLEHAFTIVTKMKVNDDVMEKNVAIFLKK